MSEFRQLSDRIWASPQISVADVAAAARLGFSLIINNRPEGESDDQTSGEQIREAATAAGLGYVAIPVTHAGFNNDQVEGMRAALQSTDGRVLAYCRSGTRSTLLWALTRAQAGDMPEDIAMAARSAGYDVTPIRELLDSLAGQAG